MKNFNFSNWLMILLGVITIMCFCITPAFAEEFGDDTEILDDGFGQRYQVTWVTASEFLPISSDTKYYLGSTGYMETRSYPMVYKAAIHLPSGAYFEGARFYFFDNDSNDSQSMVITRCTVFPQSPPNPTCKSLCSVGLNDSATPGWSSSFGNCTGGIDTIKNLDNTYQIEVWQAPSSLMSFYGVRIWWRRQISPAPAKASFWDVPTFYWAFKAIEALAASGITSGCGGGKFCPNRTVTRAEMAVFFARALGLHWDLRGGY